PTNPPSPHRQTSPPLPAKPCRPLLQTPKDWPSPAVSSGTVLILHACVYPFRVGIVSGCWRIVASLVRPCVLSDNLWHSPQGVGAHRNASVCNAFCGQTGTDEFRRVIPTKEESVLPVSDAVTAPSYVGMTNSPACTSQTGNSWNR